MGMTEPVRIEGERVVYKSKDMEIDKLYEFIWKGEKWAARNNGKDVEFLRWVRPL